jgi:archaellum component FlaF (FlaF/FlaG flagellin family)
VSDRYRGIRTVIVVLLLLIFAGAFAGIASAPAVAGSTVRVSTDSSGGQANADSDSASISADGRYLAFISAATNLVPGDTNGVKDIFVKDMVTGTTRCISTDSLGTDSGANMNWQSISADGRYVAFNSFDTNLVPGDTNGVTDIFVKDMVTGTIRCVSTDSSGTQGDQHSGGLVSFSSDGRYVAFNSAATNLVPGDANSATDSFVKDTLTGTTRRVSTNSSGIQGDQSSYSSSISADGRYVALHSYATNLVPGDTNGAGDVFVKDTVTGTTRRVSTGSSGTQGDSDSNSPWISADGRYVAFVSYATNLVPGDTNGNMDIFVKDLVTGTTRRVSTDSSGTQGDSGSVDGSISADGRYVAFYSSATNLVPGDTNGAPDVFVKDTVTGTTRRISTDSSGAQGDSDSAIPVLQSISADGRYVTFYSSATNLVPGDTNGADDVFVKDTAASDVSLHVDPVVTVPDNGETKEPVLVLVAGLSSDTGQHADGLNMTAEGQGGPWENYLSTQAAAKDLGASKVLVAPTAPGVKNWPAADAEGVIDSTGSLDDNTAKLVSWLRSPYIQQQIGDSPIIFIGHSYGGVIARSMLASNKLPEGDPIRNQIAGIIQLASPNGGSPLADWATTAGFMGVPGAVASFFFPLESDIMWQLKPSAMKSWNVDNPGRVEVPVYRIGGNYLPDALGAFGADWLDWRLDAKNKTAKAGMFALNQIFGGIENDGLVSKKSIENGDGSLAVEGWDFGSGDCTTVFPLAHADIVPGVGLSPGGVTLREIVPQSKSDPLVSWIKLRIMYILEDRAAAGGSFASGSAAPTASVRMAAEEPASPATALPLHRVSVAADSIGHVQLPLDGSATIFVSSAQGTPTVEVRDGTGMPLECPSFSSTGADGTVTTMLAVVPSEVGAHAFAITLPPGVAGDATLTGIVSGGAHFALTASERPYAGSATTVTAAFATQTGVPLTGAQVSGAARLGTDEIQLTFTDDGANGDEAAGDGAYTARFTAPTPGRWIAHVEGKHALAERMADLVIDEGEALATVDGPLVEVTPAGPGSTLASFGVEVPLSVSAEGTYTVSALVTDESGARVGLLRASAHLLASDSSTLTPAIANPQLSGTAAHRLTVAPIRITRENNGLELEAGSGPGLTTARSYATTDFYDFSVSLSGPAANPSPTHIVHFEGTALSTASTVASVEYTIDGGATWQAATPTDGVFDSHAEDFTVDLDLPDYVYGILVRQTGADGTQLPVADWGGIRFTVDTVAPAQVADLAALVTTGTGTSVAHASWLPSEPPSDTVSTVHYVVTLDGAQVSTTYDTALDVSLPESGLHTLTVTPVDAAGNSGTPSSTKVSTADAGAISVSAPSGSGSQAQGSSLPVTWTTDAAVARGQFSLWLVSPGGAWYLSKVVAAGSSTGYDESVSLNLPVADGYRVYIYYRASSGDPWSLYGLAPGTVNVTGA